ncbi:MAG: tRNA (adenosine(37)-N6)-threonylcarbamoyltransferase complex transferase subunit TsaD [[Eubacterium] sulci]|nr:tRNA (adenosine(37)-N6)-threonylcarbamoyltransferase complex transferase subunit TsaD [[Eubacterium] sulci]
MPRNISCKGDKFLTLSIESSCDETAAAVLANGRELLSNVISTQIETHKLYGGVVPEIASRQHLMNINSVIAKALDDAGLTISDIDLIAVTYGPGLIGALVIGVAAAKALALANDIPLVGVNHMHGHISSNYISYPELKPPFVSLVISGGHTNLINVKDYTSFEVIGSTRDDAVGEAYDKVARVIGLGYPGGPKIDNLAKEGDPEAIHFKRVYLDKDSLDFSFSGIKTAVLNYVNTERQANRELDISNIAAGFQEAIVDVLVDKSMQAVRQYGDGRLVLAGGVAANSRIREAVTKRCEEEGIELFLPEKKLCTDNAAMIACAGYYKYLKCGADSLRLDATANLPF